MRSYLRIAWLMAGYLFYLSYSVAAQRIDHGAVATEIKSDSYFKLQFDNDFVAGTDYYYTWGLSLELVHPSFKKNPLNKILVRPSGTAVKYGVSIDNYSFTSTKNDEDKIFYNDRPFAGCLSINSFTIASRQKNKQQFFSSVNIGLIGPAALGKGMQTEFHKLINSPTPRGWNYQVKNDLNINYTIGMDKNLVDAGFFQVNGRLRARVGTIHDNLSGGMTMILGKFNSPYKNVFARPRWQAYFFGRLSGSIIGYDATLEGGLFNRKSAYTLQAEQLKRLTLQKSIGAVVSFRSLHMGYTQTFLTKEFSLGLNHSWGSFVAGIAL